MMGPVDAPRGPPEVSVRRAETRVDDAGVIDLAPPERRPPRSAPQRGRSGAR